MDRSRSAVDLCEVPIVVVVVVVVVVDVVVDAPDHDALSSFGP